jgi:peptide/nickel transport system ATP-binding protein
MNRDAAPLSLSDASNAVLELQDLSLSFACYGEGLQRQSLTALHQVNLCAHRGEILAVVGASGSGKSLLAHAVLGILPRNVQMSGTMKYRGSELSLESIKELRGSDIAFIPQSIDYLDPLMRVGKQIADDARVAQNALEHYQLDKKVFRMYPFQLSGGMARRVLCATALVSGAKLIVADEPTPGMSAELADRAMKDFRELADDGAAIVLITHDINLALSYSDRVAVMYAGTIIENAFAADFSNESLLRHPYTKSLWRAIPQNGFEASGGAQPYGRSAGKACVYAPHCAQFSRECLRGTIPMVGLRGGEVACIHAS